MIVLLFAFYVFLWMLEWISYFQKKINQQYLWQQQEKGWQIFQYILLHSLLLKERKTAKSLPRECMLVAFPCEILTRYFARNYCFRKSEGLHNRQAKSETSLIFKSGNFVQYIPTFCMFCELSKLFKAYETTKVMLKHWLLWKQILIK